MQTWILRGFRPWVRAIMGLRFKIQIDCLENLPATGPAVLLPKHQRWEDIPLLYLALLKPLYYVAKQELFKNPLAHRAFEALGGIPLNRASPLHSRRSLRRCVNLLNSGNQLVLFPEGTYFPGKMGPGRWGMVRFLQRHLAPPFIPIGIHYRTGRPRTHVLIRIGRPRCKPAHQTEGRFHQKLVQDIAQLSNL